MKDSEKDIEVSTENDEFVEELLEKFIELVLEEE